MKTTQLLMLISVLLFSCESESEERINTLGSDISFSLAEYLEPQQKTLTFKFLTEKDFPCINYQIANTLQREGNAITIALTGIEKADVCLDAIGPATAFVDIGDLPEGEYALTIRIGKDIANSGTLTVSSEAYQLSMEEPQGLIVDNTELLRIPEDVIWGTIRYIPSHSNNELYHTLLSSMQGIGASEKRLAEGNYYYFDVDAAGRIHQKNTASDMREDPFLLEFRGDDDQLVDVLDNMEQTFGGDAMVRIYNSQGEEFKSWHND